MRVRALLLLTLPILATASPVAAQDAWPDYSVKVRATLSGSSDTSEDDAYAVYSGVALDAAVARHFGAFALELSLRTESREVEAPASGPHLGSLEMLPVGLTLQWSPRSGAGAFRPYVGAGVSATSTWEKSGALDSIDVPLHVGPLVQLGFDHRLSARGRPVGNAARESHRARPPRARGEGRSARVRGRPRVPALMGCPCRSMIPYYPLL